MDFKSGTGKMMIIIIVALLLVIAVLAAVAIVVKKQPKGEAKPEKVEKVEVHGISVSLGEFIVNLADTDELRYVKADIVLEMIGKEEEGGGHGGHGGGGDEEPPAKMRDAVIEVLSSKTFEELSTSDGKAKLKSDIIKVINLRLPAEEKVLGVYFNEFAMQ